LAVIYNATLSEEEPRDYYFIKSESCEDKGLSSKRWDLHCGFTTLNHGLRDLNFKRHYAVWHSPEFLGKLAFQVLSIWMSKGEGSQS